jgi:glutamate racemase
VTNRPEGPIGIFDSGVGGLTVLKAIRQQLPGEDILYIADQAHVPYGSRPLEEVRSFAYGITTFLLERGAKIIVVACNTASAAALHALRRSFPHTLFVGMEPAVKPAAEQTASGVVGVLATQATFQGALYASVMERFAHDVTVLQDTCPGLVAQIESGLLDDPHTRRILSAALQPMLGQGIDTIVLGCTHYPFVIPMIQEIAGAGVRVIDPAPAVARQVDRVLAAHALDRSYANHASLQACLHFYTTANPDALQRPLAGLLNLDALVSPVRWEMDRLVLD